MRIPETKPGHLNRFGPLNLPKNANGPRKGGNAYQFKKKILESKPIDLGWKVRGKI